MKPAACLKKSRGFVQPRRGYDIEHRDGMAPAQIKKYYQRFVEVDTDGSGLIGYDEFLQVSPPT